MHLHIHLHIHLDIHDHTYIWNYVHINVRDVVIRGHRPKIFVCALVHEECHSPGTRGVQSVGSSQFVFFAALHIGPASSLVSIAFFGSLGTAGSRPMAQLPTTSNAYPAKAYRYTRPSNNDVVESGRLRIWDLMLGSQSIKNITNKMKR